MNLFKDPRLLIEDGQYHTEVNKRIAIVGRFSHCNINVKNKVDILFGMNSDEGILLSQFPQVSSMISVKIVSVRHPPQNWPHQAVPALYPLLAADWGIFGPLVLFARFFSLPKHHRFGVIEKTVSAQTKYTHFCQFLNRHTTDITDLDRSLAEEVLERYVGGRYLSCMYTRVSQKIQKSEFWNVTYPSGFHRLDEPPEKISAL